AHPVRAAVLVLTPLFFQHVLVGDGHRHLCLDLQILILHVEDDLLDHFFRIFRAIDHVIDVRANQSAYSFQKSHDESPFTNRMLQTTQTLQIKLFKENHAPPDPKVKSEEEARAPNYCCQFRHTRQEN